MKLTYLMSSSLVKSCTSREGRSSAVADTGHTRLQNSEYIWKSKPN